MKNKHEIILDMCYTMRHDFGLDKQSGDLLSSGTTQEERDTLYRQMAQLFNNSILPYMDYRNDIQT